MVTGLCLPFLFLVGNTGADSFVRNPLQYFYYSVIMSLLTHNHLLYIHYFTKNLLTLAFPAASVLTMMLTPFLREFCLMPSTE